MRIAPFGTWPSPFTADRVARASVGLGGLSVDRGTLFWLEQRPAENGRTVLVARRPDGTVADRTPPPFDVGTRVHEYGGGGYHAADGLVVFSHRPDGRVFLLDGEDPRLVAAVPGCRYADFRIAPGGRSAVAVREDSRGRRATDPENTIVSLDLLGAIPPADNAGTVLVRGADFVASPRLSAAGDALAWLEWSHPDMPWDATVLRRARRVPDGPLEGLATTVAGGPGVSVVQPEWDGDALVFATDETGWWNLARAAPDGALRPLCPIEGEIGMPPWALGRRVHARLPDGRRIVALTRDGTTRAAVIGPAGRVRILPAGGVAEGPVVLADEPGRGGAPPVACVLAPADEPASIAILAVDHETASPAVVRRSAATEDPAAVSVPVAVRFPTGDGETGHAWWYRPVSATHAGPAGERPPLLVIAHGGPTSMSTDAFSAQIQWWTSRGFSVLDVNYGGSSGFGRRWRSRLDGGWGVVDVADCVAATRHLVAEGAVDPRRLAIRGRSAGGFTALLALASSDLFAAGASLYGVADLASLAAETHKFEARYLDRLVAPLAGHEALHAARSPVNRADAIGVPVIFFQGLDDRVVPPRQTRAMAAALRARGLVAPLHEFAGEGHGFRREATIRRVLELELAFYRTVFGHGGVSKT